MPTPGTVGRPGQEFRPIRQREPETWPNQGTGQVLSLTSCDFPPCDATLAGTCFPGLLVTRACCSRPPSLRGRWWTLWTVHWSRDGERIGPAPNSGRGWFIRPDAKGSGVGRVSPRPREVPTRLPALGCSESRRPIPSPRASPGVPTRAWLRDGRRANGHQRRLSGWGLEVEGSLLQQGQV